MSNSTKPPERLALADLSLEQFHDFAKATDDWARIVSATGRVAIAGCAKGMSLPFAKDYPVRMTVVHRAEAYQRAEGVLRNEGRPADRSEAMHAVVEALWTHLAACDVSWIGFYIDQTDQPDDRRLVLGPHRDKAACSPIGVHGACGRALIERRTIIIDDVRELGDAYIACDPRDLSELVIPLRSTDDQCWGVLDLDSFSVSAFSQDDVDGLSHVLRAADLHPLSNLE